MAQPNHTPSDHVPPIWELSGANGNIFAVLNAAINDLKARGFPREVALVMREAVCQSETYEQGLLAIQQHTGCGFTYLGQPFHPEATGCRVG